MRLADILKFDSPRAMIKRRVMGLPVTVEYPRGSVRHLLNDAGETVLKKRMYSDYGFLNGTKGRDGDEIDVMLGPLPQCKEIYVIHMRDLGKDVDQREDEDKVMIGFQSAAAAKAAFLLHYPANFYQSMTSFPFVEFRKKLRTSQLPRRGKMLHAQTL